MHKIGFASLISKLHQWEISIDQVMLQSLDFLQNPIKMGRKIIMSFYCRKVSSLSQKKLGGHDEMVFRHMCHKGSKYVVDILKPRIEHLEHGKMSLYLPYRKIFSGFSCTSSNPVIHNGITISLLDHVAGFCGWSSLDNPDYFVSTIDIEVQQLMPAPCEDLHFDATTTHISGEIIHVDCSCWNRDRSKKLSTGKASFKMYKNPHPWAFQVFSFLHKHFGFTTALLDNAVTFRKPKPKRMMDLRKR